MDTKEGSSRDFEGRDSESFGDENDGLISGSRGFAQQRKSNLIAKLVPVLLLISIGLNIFQLVYVSVREPEHKSLYGML